MGVDITSSVEDVLSSRERASLLMAQDLYAIRAREAATELAGVIGLEGESAEQFLGSVATRIDGMDWEQRRRAAESLRTAAQDLGVTALDPVGRTAELKLIAGADTDDGEVRQSAQPPLNRQQRSWLSSVVDEPVVDDIEALPVAGRLVFANNVGRAYQALPVRRQSEADKADRAHHLSELMAGKTFAEIAEAAETREINVANRFKSMATIITRDLSPEEIIAMIPGEYTEEGSTENLLNHLQKNWYEKVFREIEDAETRIAALDPKQLDHLAELLGRRLNAYIIRRNGPEKTRRRMQQMTMLIRGDNMTKIMEASGLAEGNVKSELHRSAMILGERVSAEDLEGILQQAADYEE